ncbi:DUF4179 domain-containing protein [Sporosarcina thermotolerans]|uniref:DUF4179 domain-containing protein n=1 Tax=Sporosarcina thermotolerans TaxID=633404 RepID=A0AAW9A904_9BACL|nr:DUF4179 domain-containing protein [Sporosarcina thermotolerans]MDW0117534.1 DUF4179 domain-containing protein [Sporosarcina thermotolerans]WHT49697.1 DUF4179 domain-containing protein [Sporosarcina thermotolerans]
MEEERKLKKWKEEVEKREVPADRLDQAIQIGFEAAKRNHTNKKRGFMKRSIWSTAIAAVLILAFVTSIRVSPAFANALSSIPGLSGIIELIQDNKGIQMAIENEHYQMIGTTGETDSMKVTLEGIITDETSLIVFSKIENNKKYPKSYLSGYRILDSNGKEIPNGQFFSTVWNQKNDLLATNTTEIKFESPVPTEEMILEYEITGEFNGEQVIDTIQIPFKVELKPVKKEHYAVNKTVVVDGQKIHIHSITIGPIKTAVEVEYDAKNTKKIFGFEDLRILDEKGEVWSAIKNGSTASWSEDSAVISYFLQSNYFRDTEHLYLQFNKLMAMDKDEAELIIDTETKEILKQPNDKRFSNLKIHGSHLEIELKGGKGYYHDPFSTFYDAEGKALSQMSGTYRPGSDDVNYFGLELPDVEFKNPLTFPLHAYPSYIKGDVKIKIK